MTDLTKYGFTKELETERYDNYVGHGFTITVYHYLYTMFDGTQILRETFVVSTKQYMTKAFPISQLKNWLKENNIDEQI